LLDRYRPARPPRSHSPCAPRRWSSPDGSIP